MNRSRLFNSTALSRVASLKNGPAMSRKNQVEVVQNTQVWPISGIDIPLGLNETGLIVSNPMSIDEGGIYVEASVLDASELRRALLFWDKIVWPETNGIYFQGGVDEEFLESAGILFRPSFGVSGDGAAAIAKAYLTSFKTLTENGEPNWAMSSAAEKLLSGNGFAPDAGITTNLVSAIPVPDREVPLADILEFRQRHKDELIELRLAIDDFYQDWVNSESQDHALKLALRKIAIASENSIKAAKAASFPLSLSTWKVDFSVSGSQALASILAFVGGRTFDFADWQSGLLAGASFVSIGTALGQKDPNANLTPYNYAVSIERRLW